MVDNRFYVTYTKSVDSTSVDTSFGCNQWRTYDYCDLLQVGFIFWSKTIHPSIVNRLSKVRPRGKQLEHRVPDFPFICNIGWLWLGDLQAFTGQWGDIISPSGPGSAPKSPPSWPCQQHLPKEVPRWHPNQLPKPSQLVFLHTKEQ